MKLEYPIICFVIRISVAVNLELQSQEWVMQKIYDLGALIPLSNDSILYLNDKRQTLSCIEYCVLAEQCSSVVITDTSCHSTSYPTLEHRKYLSSALNEVFVKRPVRVCYTHGYIFYKGICVKPSFSKKTWGKAKVDCEITGGQLISFDSEEKYNKTLEFMKNMYLNGRSIHYYIGASDLANESVWMWTNGTPLTAESYKRFKNGQANNIDMDFPGKAANCASLRPHNIDTLVDEYCGQQKAYICEM